MHLLGHLYFDGSTLGRPPILPLALATVKPACKKCGGLLGMLNDGYLNILITIASLKNPNLIVPNKKPSYRESAPLWWETHFLLD